jgi:hypothetical protein
MEPLTNAQRRAVLSEFLDHTEAGGGLLPAPKPLPYDPVPGIATAAWCFSVAAEMLAGELRELTNQLNGWLANLRRWHAWNEVLGKHDEEVRWATEREWVEPLAFQCMLQPSAMRDRFIMVATNALHQVRIALDPEFTDTLLGDPTTPQERRFFPSRRDKERQLKKLAKTWSAGKAFVQALEKLDDRGHRGLTADYRNRASHGIAPHFSVGYTALVTRTREQATALEKQADGTFRLVPVPDKMATSYGFGGTPPLSMEHARETNRAQFDRARHTFDAYLSLLTEAVTAIPRRPEPPMKGAPPIGQNA